MCAPRTRTRPVNVFGNILLVVALSLANIFILPNFYGIPEAIAIGVLLLISALNVSRCAISILLNASLEEVVMKRFLTRRPQSLVLYSIKTSNPR